MPRVCGEQVYHHIYAWGNDRHPVFKSATHYEKYLELLEAHTLAADIGVVAYALMQTHVHLFIYDRENMISRFMMRLHGDYARYYNKVNERVGHVFGERFNNKIVLANLYGKWLSRYIHRQAIEACLVKDPAGYPWSSYRVYLGLEQKAFVRPDVILLQFGEDEKCRREYRKFVLAEDNGPVDWQRRDRGTMAGIDLVQHICREVDIEVSVVMKPRGARARQLRHRVMRIAAEKYGCRPFQIAAVFGVSRAAVSRVLA
ncbi:transposase [candidate division WOR-3 bacterium]|nr:transposase [candidate division WOR-3 bacterium]